MNDFYEKHRRFIIMALFVASFVITGIVFGSTTGRFTYSVFVDKDGNVVSEHDKELSGAAINRTLAKLEGLDPSRIKVDYPYGEKGKTEILPAGQDDPIVIDGVYYTSDREAQIKSLIKMGAMEEKFIIKIDGDDLQIFAYSTGDRLHHFKDMTKNELIKFVDQYKNREAKFNITEHPPITRVYNLDQSDYTDHPGYITGDDLRDIKSSMLAGATGHDYVHKVMSREVEFNKRHFLCASVFFPVLIIFFMELGYGRAAESKQQSGGWLQSATGMVNAGSNVVILVFLLGILVLWFGGDSLSGVMDFIRDNFPYIAVCLGIGIIGATILGIVNVRSRERVALKTQENNMIYAEFLIERGADPNKLIGYDNNGNGQVKQISHTDESGSDVPDAEIE